MIYLNNYLSVMFNISDVMIDKEEIAMKMELPIHIPDEIPTEETTVSCVPESVVDEQIIVSQEGFCVPEPHTKPSSEKWLKCWKHKALCAVDAQKPSIYYLHYQPARI